MKGKITGVWIDEVVNAEFDKRYNWCLENLGLATDYPPRWEPIGIGNPKFKFRDPKDELLYLLRWGA